MKGVKTIMTFNLEHMKERSNLFWDAYFRALELLDGDRGKFVDEVPIVREIPITDDLMFRIGRKRSKWELVYIPTGCGWLVNELDDATRAFELMSYYLEYQVV
jgi:hypothetical protein